MPLRIARWMPFSRIELTKLAASPTMSAPSAVERRLRVPPALGQRLGAVAHQLAALEQPATNGMLLEALERGVRIEQRVLVVEADDEAERQPPVRQRVDAAAAELLLAQRIAERVDHRARRPAGRPGRPRAPSGRSQTAAGCARSPSGSVRISCLVRLPRTPSAKIVTLARMSAPGSNVAAALAVLAEAAVAGAHADDATRPRTAPIGRQSR